MKLSQDSWLGLGIIAALLLVTVLTGIQQGKEPPIPYLSTSAAPDGALALKLWLDELGYANVSSSLTNFDPQDSTTMFILQPLLEISKNEWNVLDQWVEQGGLLILAGDNAQTDAAMGHYDFSLTYLPQPLLEFSASTPLLTSPPVPSRIKTQASHGLSAQRSNFLPLVSANAIPVIVSFDQGRGKVILSSTPHPFSNQALKDDTNATLILNLMTYSPLKGQVSFDEWHHGFRSESVIGPSQWLQHTPGGHAILFVVGLIFIALLLQGRAFGRPIPLAHEIKRRSSLEHVTAIANLNRKAGHKNEVLKQYHQRVKRHLGMRYRIDPTMNDADYVNLLSQYNASIDRDALLNLLKRLSQKNVNEAELLKLASEAARWTNN
jgi:hypothetical protein